jgi:hypothetical protein
MITCHKEMSCHGHVTFATPTKTSQFSVIRRFLGIGSHASESYYHSYMVATSGVHRLASQICHNRLFRKKLQQNILPMISTEVSSLAAHNTSSLKDKTATGPCLSLALRTGELSRYAALVVGRPDKTAFIFVETGSIYACCTHI